MAPRFRCAFIFILALLAACAPAPSPADTEAEIATIVAATMQAQVAPTETGEPIDGEIPAVESAYGMCANSGQISVVYVKDGDVRLWVEGGLLSQLTNTGDVQDVRISQDGCRIAYSRSIPNPAYDPNAELSGADRLEELWVVSSDGSLHQKLAGLEFFATLPIPIEAQAYSLYRFEWQPGTHTLAMGTRMVFMGPGLAPNNDVFMVNTTTAEITQLLAAGQGGDFYFSHDGQRIALARPNSVGVVNTDGSGLQDELVSFPFVLTYSEYAYYPPVHWTPNDDALMFAVPPEDGLAGPVDGVYPETTLWYVPLDGTPPIEAGQIQTAWFVTQEVQFSPDLGRIAYIRQYGPLEAGQFEMVLALSDGSNESLGLQINEIMFGDWAQDNTRFIYWFNQAGVFSMFHGIVDSLNVTPISTLTAFEAAAAEIEWVEDDTFVLMLQGNAGAELSLMQLSGDGVLIDTSATPFVPFDVAH